ncbi:MAG: rRNA maturation RNase YbeY [Gammaproteobacteria bacterium]|nr:rRNA maturation RNase YbeY [Gammaproteobacteria bacterium]
MRVDVQIAAGGCTAPAAANLRRWAERALQDDTGEVCVRVVGAAEAGRLNGRYRGIDEPTNVLSFPSGAELTGKKHLGDVVVCAPVVEAEAQEQNKLACDHYAHMVVHGVLHLRGFDHESAGEAQVMESLETAILNEMGIADPYTV